MASDSDKSKWRVVQRNEATNKYTVVDHRNTDHEAQALADDLARLETDPVLTYTILTPLEPGPTWMPSPTEEPV